MWIRTGAGCIPEKWFRKAGGNTGRDECLFYETNIPIRFGADNTRDPEMCFAGWSRAEIEQNYDDASGFHKVPLIQSHGKWSVYSISLDVRSVRKKTGIVTDYLPARCKLYPGRWCAVRDPAYMAWERWGSVVLIRRGRLGLLADQFRARGTEQRKI